MPTRVISRAVFVICPSRFEVVIYVLKIEREKKYQPGSPVYLEHLPLLTATWQSVGMCPSPFVEVGSASCDADEAFKLVLVSNLKS